MNKRNKNKHSEKKNLLIYAHYYIPDTASTGQILRELAEGMLDRLSFCIYVVAIIIFNKSKTKNTKMYNI